MHTITHHLGRIAPGRGHQFVTNHQQAKIVARHVTLDQDVVAKLTRGGIRTQQVFFGLDIDGDPFALVAIVGLYHHRQADLQRGRPRVFGVKRGAPARHWHTGCGQQFFGEIFVLRDGFRDGAGNVHFGRLNATLFAAPAEAHHAAFGHAAVGNVACHSCVDNAAGTGP